MRIRSLPVAVAACALVLSGSALSSASADDVPPPPPPAPGPVRIMIAGDSITQGFDGDYTWRYRLVQEFKRQNVPVDFVGPRKYTYGGANHYLVTGWDSDHDALGATRLVDQLPRIKQDMDAYTPDVLIASYGTTDLLHGSSVAATIANWTTYIDTARAEAAAHGQKLTIVLGEVMSPRILQRTELNASVRKLAAAKSTTDNPVVVYDLAHSGWDPARHTYDKTHPTPTGETVIAQRVAWALNGLKILPGAPKIWRSFVPWPPTLRPVVRIDRHRRLVVNWESAKRANKTQYMRMRLTDVRSGRSRPTTWTRDLRLVQSLRPGLYRVSVRGMRGTMTSTWGPTVTVRVPRR